MEIKGVFYEQSKIPSSPSRALGVYFAGMSGLSSSAVDAAEVTVEQPAADTTVSQDTGNPSADTKEAAEGQTEGETTEPERIEPDAYFEPIQSNDTADWPRSTVWAESAVVMDLDSGTFLYSKNMDVAKYPASITKILTTLIAIEHSHPSEKVTFSGNAVYGIEQGSSNIGIRLGENLTMEDCLYGMMLESAVKSVSPWRNISAAVWMHSWN